jgi:hypothetical protein
MNKRKTCFMKYKLIALIVIITGILFNTLQAQVSCTAKAPGRVSEGQAFSLTYELNEKADKLPAIDFANFRYAGGPSTRMSSSTTFINGKLNSTQSYSYTYTLIAEKEGTFTLPGVTFTVKNQAVKSNSLSIVVTAASQNQQQPPQPQSDNRQAATVQGFNKEDFFIKTFVSNANPYVGEQVIVSYKLYLGPQTYDYRAQITSRPTAQGFWTYDLEEQNASANRKEEIIDGKKFTVIDMYSMVVYPQKSGKLTVSPLGADMIVQVVVQQQRSRSNDIFDFFSDPFFSGNRVQNIELKLSSNPVNIHATELPAANKPDEFSGLVGDFKLSAKLSRDKLAAHDATNLTVIITGSGNLQYIEPLNFNFPSDIAVHEPVVKDNINVSLSGVSGSRTFEYVLIPEAEGSYTISPASFSYFDKRKKSYITLTTPEFNLEVEKGQAGNVVSFNPNKTDIKVLGSDIRHIKTNRNLQLRKAQFFLSPSYWVFLFAPVLMLIIFIILLRKKIEERKNVVLLRDKKASKTARKRLRKAEKLLQNKQAEAFYIEISKVLWGYISDKFHIPLGQLSLETAYQKLSERNMPEDSINEFINTLNDCEYVRFAPSSDITPDNMYERTFNFITKIERELKNK